MGHLEVIDTDHDDGVETRTSLCLYSTPFTFHPTALLLSLRSELLFTC